MLGFLLVAVMMHPVHETVAEIEWNPETHRLEVALRLDALDEQWLRRRATKSQPTEDHWELNYVKSRFRTAEPPAENDIDSIAYRWLGRDEERGHVWWYFEIEPFDKQPPAWIEHRVLFEKEENQANRVVLLGGVPKRTLILTMQRPKAFLNQAGNDESDSNPQTGR